MLRGYRWQFWLLAVLALLPLPAAEAIIDNKSGIAIDWHVLAGLAGGVAVLWAISWIWMSFNSLVQLRNRVTQASSLIDVQLEAPLRPDPAHRRNRCRPARLRAHRTD